MNDFTFSRTDLEDINAHGLNPDAVNDQLRMFSRGVSPPELIAPCTLDNGVTALDSDSLTRLEDIFRQAVDQGRITKFIPASGAATRMFKELIKAYHNKDENPPASDTSVATLIDNISRFACHDDLVQILKKNGLLGNG